MQASRIALYACLTLGLAALAWYVLSAHQAHVFGWLPYLLVMLCPLMHLLHHRRHGSHSGPKA